MKRAAEVPSDLLRAEQILRATEELVDKLHDKYGTEAESLAERALATHRRLVKSAALYWVTRNFRRLEGGDEDDGKGLPSEAPTKSILRASLNQFFSQLGLPTLGKKDPLWNDYVLCDLFGASSGKSGRRLSLIDCRSLGNFERTLEDLLALVRRERQPPSRPVWAAAAAAAEAEGEAAEPTAASDVKST